MKETSEYEWNCYSTSLWPHAGTARPVWALCQTFYLIFFCHLLRLSLFSQPGKMLPSLASQMGVRLPFFSSHTTLMRKCSASWRKRQPNVLRFPEPTASAVVWKARTCWSLSSPVILDNMSYVSTTYLFLFSVQAESFALLWGSRDKFHVRACPLLALKAKHHTHTKCFSHASTVLCYIVPYYVSSKWLCLAIKRFIYPTKA